MLLLARSFLVVTSLTPATLGIVTSRAGSGFTTALSFNTTTGKTAFPSFKLSGALSSSDATARGLASRREEEFECDILSGSANWQSFITSQFILSSLEWTGARADNNLARLKSGPLRATFVLKSSLST
ncbi:hypothetical protein C8R45DRAFT_1075116 [Mycena sanguinolenta]|nr:hypothetical protein C8R45DRAFT_1075116 [Mycena sanguinolenta]